MRHGPVYRRPIPRFHFRVLHRELENAGIRQNQTKPVFVKRVDKGGIDVRTTVEQTHLTPEKWGTSWNHLAIHLQL